MTTRARRPAKPHSKAKAARRVLSLDEQWALGIKERLIADAHPWQRDAILDPSQLISMLVGRGGGKTTTARARAIIKLTSIRKAKLVYIATTRSQAEELMWGPLKDTIEYLGLTSDFLFNESKLRCTCVRTGATYRLVGADDKREIEKLRGQPFDEVQVDEGASYVPMLLENLLDRIIGPRIGERNGTILLFGTPGHILRGPFYDATRPGSDQHRPYADRDKPEYLDWDNWSSHAWSLKMVVELPEAATKYPALCALWAKALRDKKRKAWSDTHPIWMREYLGLWAADDTDTVFQYRPHIVVELDGEQVSKLWNRWEPERVGPMKFARLPEERSDWHFVIACDKGFSDEFAINVYAFSPTDPDRRIYHVYAFERVKMYARLVAELLLGEKLDHAKPAGLLGAIGTWPDGMVADADEAFLAELTNVYGLQMAKAEKRSDYKFGAIELVNGDLVDGRIAVLAGSPLEVQLQQLQWKENEFGVRKEDKAQANHSTDTLVYGRKLISDLFETGAVVYEATTDTTAGAYSDPMKLGADEDEIPGESTDEFGSLLSDASYDEMFGNG